MMRRALSIFSAALLAVTAPAVAFAQTVGTVGQTSDGQPVVQQQDQGQGAYAQQPPPQDDNTGLYVAGGVVLGGAALAGYLISKNKSDNNNSSSPASP